MLRACAVQTDPRLGRPAENAASVADEVRAAARERARLAVFPEAALTGYMFDSRQEALEGAVRAEGPELAAVAEACREAGIWAVVGAIERARRPGAEEGVLYNTAFVLGPDGPAGRQRKVHILHLGADRFTLPSPEPFRTFDLPFGRIGVHICYDGSFPESARALRLAGARLLVLPTNWPDLRIKPAVVRVRAYENHAFYLAVNRVGTERGVRFEGGSCAADPFGELLFEAGAEPGRTHVELDLAVAGDSRVVVEPDVYEYDRIADRRPETYGPLVGAEPLPKPGAQSERSRSKKAR